MNKIKNEKIPKKEIVMMICISLCLVISFFGIWFASGVIYLLVSNIFSWLLLSSFILIFISNLYLLIFWRSTPEIAKKIAKKIRG